MITAWNGFGFSESDVVSTDIFVPRTVRVQLSAIPGIPTVVQLSAITRAARLYTASETIWYALDVDPGPILAPTTDLLVYETAFQPGDVLLPGQWQVYGLPLDSLVHELHLSSESESPVVTIVMLEEQE
jgi:hypothetical protein